MTQQPATGRTDPTKREKSARIGPLRGLAPFLGPYRGTIAGVMLALLAAASLGGDSPEAGMRRIQLDMRERKKLREDLEQLEATIFRRLQELLLTEVGADKAAELGELPKKRRGMPMIQFGG